MASTSISKKCSALKSIFDRLIEGKTLISNNPSTFVVHVWIQFLVGFLINLISLGYSNSACFANIHQSSQLFNFHLTFHSSIFVGALIHSNFTRRISIKIVLSGCVGLISATLFLLPNAYYLLIYFCIFSLLGICLGICFSATSTSFIKCFKQQQFVLVHCLHLIGGVGSVTSAMFYQASSEDHRESCNQRRSTLKPVGPHIPSLEKFHLNADWNLDYIYYVIAILQLPMLFVIHKSDFNLSLKTSISIRRTEYDEIQSATQLENAQSLTQQNDVTSLKLVILCSLIASISNVIFTLFPFSILSQSGATIGYYQLFLIFFTAGRLTAVFTADFMAPYFLLAVSIFGCGVGCCCIASEQFLLVGSVIFGFFLSPILPALITYINQGLSLKSNNTLTLISGHCSGNAIFPLLLTLTTSSNSRLFIAFNFVALVILVIVLVSILSLHAQIERMHASQSGLNLFVSRFLSGESLLKRTRSIRPLISRLRPNSYRRFANRRGQTPRSPSPACLPATNGSQIELSIEGGLAVTPSENTGFLTPTRV